MKPLLNFEDEKLTTLKVDSDFFFFFFLNIRIPAPTPPLFLSQLLALKTIQCFHYQH